MVKSALKAPYTVVVIALMVLVVGLFAMLRLPLDILPAFRLPAVMVVTTYRGMPSQMIEMDITNRLERWLSQASGLDHIESRSLAEVRILNCYFQPGFDPNNALAQIGNLVASDLHYLPPGTLPPIVMAYDPTSNLPVGVVSVFTPDLDEAKIWDESNYIVRSQLNSVAGAVAPVVFGGKLRQMMVYLNRGELVGHGLSPLDVVNVLKSGNAMIPTGDAKMGTYDYSITSNGMVPTLEDFDNIAIKVEGRAPVFVRDVGRTRDSSAVQTNAVQVNGVRQTFIPIFKRVGSNTLAVVEGIRTRIPKILNLLPPRTALHLLFDQSVNVRDAINDVIRELLIGVLLASIVIFFFLGNLRATMIAGLAIPLSIIGCMAGLYFLNQSLNLMTLGALALVTGPLIDMAVVILENIERHLEKGAPPHVASEVGTEEVSLPVLVSALALIIVFFPVVFFEGLGKFLFTPMAIAVAIAVIISYFTAVTAVPLAASRFFKPHDNKNRHEVSKPVAIFNRAYDSVKRRYADLLGHSLRKPSLIVSLVVLGLVVSLLLLPFIGSEFFPVSDHGQFYLRLRAPTGTRIEKTTKLVGQVSDSIKSILPPGSAEIILANTGVLRSWAAAYTPNSATHEALLEIQLADGSISAQDAITKLRAQLPLSFPNLQVTFSMIDPVSSALNYGALSPINLRVTGPDLRVSDHIARDLLGRIALVPGVTDSYIEQELDYPSLHIDVDRTKAAYLGLTTDVVIKNVVTATSSSVQFSRNFWDDPQTGNSYFIGVMYPEDEMSMENILNIPVKAPGDGDTAPTLLRNIAVVTPETLPVEISHYNLQRTINVVAGVEERALGVVAADIDKIVSSTKVPKSYSVEWGGAIEAMRASFGNLGTGMVLSLVLIFLLMVAQLKSFVDPLLVLATIPAGFIGVFWMLFLTDTTFNIQSMMGMIMLIGIVVSNSVILTDFANQRLAAGAPADIAMREAGLVRLRPILMTAISTVMALTPSALSGANAPLARAVIGGLLSATFLTLVFLPSLYVLVKGRSRAPRPAASVGAIAPEN